jgi:aldehyde:ferredoxin oxidoreductase
MGSKNLKAIAVKGALPFTVADEKMIEDLAEIGNKRIRAKKLMMTEYGTAGSLLYWNMIGALATENHRRRNFSTAEEISGEEMARRFKVKNHGCYRCPIACAQIVKMENEKHEIETSTGPELETLISLGSKCGIHDLEVIIKANDLCNRMGLDTISTGATIAMAMEMNELGIINDSTTGGMDVCFGNAMILLDLIEMISYRRGFGDLLAEGSFLASIKLGAPDLALCVNGMEIPGVDPRATFGMGLSYVTSNRGACHLRSMLYVEEVFEAKLNRFSVKGKAEELKYKEDLMAVLDSVLMCKFAQRHAGYELIDLTNLLRGITGIEFTVDNLLEVGDRIYTLERLYNAKQRKLDAFLPNRFYEEPLSNGSDKGGTIDREEFMNEILRYYQIRGWDRDGNPSPEKLQQLGISYS